MTPQEYDDKKVNLLNDYRDDVLSARQAIKALDTLHAEYVGSIRSPYYQFIERFDQLRAVLKLSEGSPAQQITMCEALSAHCAEYAQTLKESVK